MPDLNQTTPPSSPATPGDLSDRAAPTPLAELGQAGGPRPFPGRARAGNEISVLFPLLTLYTAAYLALLAAEFFLRGSFAVPAGMMPVYIALLGAYATDKEVRRWIGAAEPPRKGSVFVYLWLLFFLGAFMLASFRPEFILPDELGKVVLQVLGIFFGSKVSKYLHGTRGSAEEYESARAARQARHGGQAEILEMLKGIGKVTNREVAARLQVSARSASRLLTELTAQGSVWPIGEGRGTHYVLS